MIAFITGASAGFGAAIARRFVAEGQRVILAARRRERLQQLAAELGERAWVFELDVREPGDLAARLETLPPAFREIDVLVNNAGLALGLAPAHQASLEDWETMVQTNILGLLKVTRCLLPGFVARSRGHVINLGSTAGEWPYPGAHVYGASKAFVRQFSLNLRADLYATPVRVSNIEPGLAGGTEFSEVRFHGDTSRAAQVYANTRPLSAEDVAEAVWWCARLPAHVNVNTLSLTPVCQGFAPVAVHRESQS
ncbi:MAG TPA: SDR family NAD(P)-dependent oxidoreductase [Nevskiaceae bacterium]|nr:SDR family NAD(P)-dependent oxidoreductase [Nevskiaceae bacterium]